MAHLAVLIGNPRQEILAVDLVAGLAALSSAVGDLGPAQPVLDRDAIGEYKKRLHRLEAEVDQQESADSVRAASARAERDWLTAQLASPAGFGLRTRSFPDQPERARVAVGKAIRRALVRITEARSCHRLPSEPGGPHRGSMLRPAKPTSGGFSLRRRWR